MAGPPDQRTMQAIAANDEHRKLERALRAKPYLTSIHSLRLTRLLAKLNDCYQVYLDLGIKYYTNVPLKIFRTNYDAFFDGPQGDPRYIRDYYDSVHEPQMTFDVLLEFNECQHTKRSIEDALAMGELEEVPGMLDKLEEMTDEYLVPIVEENCQRFEDLVAGANSLAARERWPKKEAETDTEKRMEAWKMWARHVKTVGELNPDAADFYAEVFGWERDG